MISKKICLLGASAVGKTSLTRRFVEGEFSDRYLTTIGVKIVKKELTMDGIETRLILWDVSGEDDYAELRMSYLRGSSGYLLVADPTRKETMTKALDLDQRVLEALGDTPRLLLMNKVDLREDWRIEAPEAMRGRVIETSAKTGAGVEDAFGRLAQEILQGA